MPGEQPSSMIARVAALEVGVKTLHSELADVRTGLERSHASLAQTLDRIQNDLHARNRVNWGWVGSVGGVLLAVVAAVGAAWIRPLAVADDYFALRINELHARADVAYDGVVRMEERLRNLQGDGRGRGGAR